MFTKTSSYFFQKYGITYLSKPDETNDLNPDRFYIDTKKISTVFYNQEEVYICVNKGIALLYISFENDANTFESFVIHHYIKLKKHCYYNIISISESSEITSFTKNHSTLLFPLKGEMITHNAIKPTISISEILVYYYQVKNSNYVFEGETHPYWELTYVDSGSLITNIDGIEYELQQHDIVFYAPGQFHTQRTDKTRPCSFLTIIFEMDCPYYEALITQTFHSSRKIVNLLQDFISTCDDTENNYNDLLFCYLSQIIVELLQSKTMKNTKVAQSPIQQKFENEFLNEIILYINQNYSIPITVDHLCHKFSISRSSLQQLFNKNINIAPKQYITNIKLKHAKLLIKENKYTISEISEKLGFTSIHYFSRKFKNEFNISPSDYAKSIYKQ